MINVSNWSKENKNSFQLIRDDIIDAKKLSRYDPNKLLILAADPSHYGLGAALMQQFNVTSINARV